MSEEDPPADPLDALTETSKLFIKQRVELLEVIAQTAANALDMDMLGALGETANKYDAYTDDGGLQFKVVETSDLCGFWGCCPSGRACCRPNHKLQLHVYAPQYSEKKEIMYMERPCKCGQCCACCECCTQEMDVFKGDSAASEGEQIAHITQPLLGGGLSPKLLIMDREGGEVQAEIQSNAVCCIGGMCCDHTFTVKDVDGNDMGKIVKEKPEGFQDILKELGTDADNFTLHVPVDLPPEQKAALLAALHLVDYMFFEDEGAANIDMTPLMEGSCPETTIKLCDCYCFGCLCPCKCTFGGKSDDNPEEGGEEGGEDEPEEEPEEEEPEEEEPEEEEPEEEE